MTTTWSAASHGLYVGIDMSASDMTPVVGQSVTITIKWYVKSATTYNETDYLGWQIGSGNPGLTQFYNTIHNTTQLIQTRTTSYTATTSSHFLAAYGSVSTTGQANPSVTAGITVAGGMAPPTAPSASAATSITSTSAVANWTAASPHNTPVTSYAIQWSTSPSFGSDTRTVTGLSASATSYTITGLLPNTTYYYRLDADSSQGYGPTSSAIGFTTSVSNPTPPTAITLTDSSAPGVFSLTSSWTPGASNGATGITFNSLLSRYNNSGAYYWTLSSAALSTGGPITALPISSLALASSLVAGDTVSILSGTHVQTFIVTAGSTTTSIKVASTTPNFAYPSGSTVFIGTLKTGITTSSATFYSSGDGVVGSTTYFNWVSVNSTSPSSTGGYTQAGNTVTTGKDGGVGDLVDRVNALATDIGDDMATVAAMFKEHQAGIAAINVVAVNTQYTQAVTFTTPYASPPVVVAMPNTSIPQNCFVGTTVPTTTGFTIYIYRTSGTGVTSVQWIATPKTQ